MNSKELPQIVKALSFSDSIKNYYSATKPSVRQIKFLQKHSIGVQYRHRSKNWFEIDFSLMK